MQDVVEELSTALLTKAQEARGLPAPRGLSPSGSAGDILPMVNGVVPLNLNSALANSATSGPPAPSGPIKGESLKDLYAKLDGGAGEDAAHGPPEAQPESEGGSPEKPKLAKKSAKTRNFPVVRGWSRRLRKWQKPRKRRSLRRPRRPRRSRKRQRGGELGGSLFFCTRMIVNF